MYLWDKVPILKITNVVVTNSPSAYVGLGGLVRQFALGVVVLVPRDVVPVHGVSVLCGERS